MSVTVGPGLQGKRLELLHAVVPKLSRVAVLLAATGPDNPEILAGVLDATGVLGLAVHTELVRGPAEFDSAFEAIVRERAEAIYPLGSPLFTQNRGQLAELALLHRLPSIQTVGLFAYGGFLMTYGPSFNAIARRGAYYVDRILKGTKPADLPVEQPMTFEFVVNMKTAAALGLTFPNEIMLQVTEVIE